ncbi:MAG: hypothetical protein ACYTAN_17395 [Planctomycetota bacterium]
MKLRKLQVCRQPLVVAAERLGHAAQQRSEPTDGEVVDCVHHVEQRWRQRLVVGRQIVVGERVAGLQILSRELHEGAGD